MIDNQLIHQNVLEVSRISLNPYKPSVLFVGHWQTVQTQTRRRCSGYSLVACRMFYLNLNKNEKYLATLKLSMDSSIDNGGKFHSAYIYIYIYIYRLRNSLTSKCQSSFDCDISGSISETFLLFIFYLPMAPRRLCHTTVQM